MALEGRLPARIDAMSVICVVCERETVPGEETRVRSNVRAFREEAFRYFRRLTRPGAGIALGTPNADVIDLGKPEAFVHTLHAPYHRHILSKSGLLSAGERQGWKPVHYYPTMYSNTKVPFLNEAFYLY